MHIFLLSSLRERFAFFQTDLQVDVTSNNILYAVHVIQQFKKNQNRLTNELNLLIHIFHQVLFIPCGA